MQKTKRNPKILQREPQSSSLEVSKSGQDDVTRKAAVYAAFYHRGRREFVLWTVDEIAIRAGISPASAFAFLRSMLSSREAKAMDVGGPDNKKGIKGWFLTSAGRAIAQDYMQAAA